jgi:hypothetical protein
MTLSPLSPNAVNSKSPTIFSTPQTNSKMALSPVKTLNQSPSLAPSIVADEENWTEETSSPFVTELPVSERSLSPSSIQATLRNHLSPINEFSSTETLTPGARLRLEATPFEICEDRTSTPPVLKSHSLDLSELPPLPKPDTPESSELLDMTAMTVGEDDAGIDDSCFSTFSEVPNADMTAFARLTNQSPSKYGYISAQVRRTLPENSERY